MTTKTPTAWRSSPSVPTSLLQLPDYLRQPLRQLEIELAIARAPNPDRRRIYQDIASKLSAADLDGLAVLLADETRAWREHARSMPTRPHRRTPALHPIYASRRSKEHALLQSLVTPDDLAYFADALNEASVT